ncbi:MAG TPA: acyl carrier protein [Candidatus Omnitrophota bacterium]|nr:acyl carrier protein [Candidatus Omnitrophota bacterium]
MSVNKDADLSKIKNEVMCIIADITEESVKNLKNSPRTNFLKGSNLDSLKVLEIISALEKKFEVEIEERHFPRLTGVNEIAVLIKELSLKDKRKKSTAKK